MRVGGAVALRRCGRYRVPRDRIGHIMFDNLIGDSKGEHGIGREIVIDPELVVRETTGLANKG